VSQPEIIFYDGHCGLCHGFVRFVVRRDHRAHFVFAPLHGQHFLATVPPPQRVGLPDSVVVLDAQGRLLLKSSAVLYVMRRLGGIWRGASAVMGVLPASLRDFFYDRIARIRKKLFAPPPEVCPVLPPELRARFRP